MLNGFRQKAMPKVVEAAKVAGACMVMGFVGKAALEGYSKVAKLKEAPKPLRQKPA